MYSVQRTTILATKIPHLRKLNFLGTPAACGQAISYINFKVFVSVSVFVTDCVCDSVCSVIEWVCDCCVTEYVLVTLVHMFVFVCDRGCPCVWRGGCVTQCFCVWLLAWVCVCDCLRARLPVWVPKNLTESMWMSLCALLKAYFCLSAFVTECFYDSMCGWMCLAEDMCECVSMCVTEFAWGSVCVAVCVFVTGFVCEWLWATDYMCMCCVWRSAYDWVCLWMSLCACNCACVWLKCACL